MCQHAFDSTCKIGMSAQTFTKVTKLTIFVGDLTMIVSAPSRSYSTSPRVPFRTHVGPVALLPTKVGAQQWLEMSTN